MGFLHHFGGILARLRKIVLAQPSLSRSVELLARHSITLMLALNKHGGLIAGSCFNILPEGFRRAGSGLRLDATMEHGNANACNAASLRGTYWKVSPWYSWLPRACPPGSDKLVGVSGNESLAILCAKVDRHSRTYFCKSWKRMQLSNSMSLEDRHTTPAGAELNICRRRRHHFNPTVRQYQSGYFQLMLPPRSVPCSLCTAGWTILGSAIPPPTTF